MATKNFISAFRNLTPDVFLLKDRGARKTSSTSHSIRATLDNLLCGPVDSENGVRLRHDGRSSRRKLNSRRSYIIPTGARHENPPQNRNSCPLLCFIKTLWAGILDTNLCMIAGIYLVFAASYKKYKTGYAVIYRIRRYRGKENLSVNIFHKNIEHLLFKFLPFVSFGSFQSPVASK